VSSIKCLIKIFTYRTSELIERVELMKRYILRDDLWKRIKNLLPGRQGSVGCTAKDNRLFVQAVLYRYRVGIPGRDLPERFGHWKNIHRRWRRWSVTGIWEKVFTY
jgi:transposase